MPVMVRLMDPARLRRDESGTIAVMVGLLSMVILGMAAIAVDMGQVYAKRASLQSAVDQAVLAAAAKIDGNTGPCTAEAQSTAKTFLVSNWIDQGGDPKAVSNINLGGGATDGDGYMTCTGWRVDLWAPTAKVDLGLAEAIPGNDLKEIQVPAHAAAEIKSPKLATLPMYISAGCVSGSQVTITDPPNGHTPDLQTPNFPETGSDNGLTIGQVRPNRFLDDDIASGATNVKVQLGTGGKYEVGDRIWFTNHDALSDKHSYTVGSVDVGSNQTTFPLPAAVTSTPGIWWVRVDRGGLLTPDTEAEAITVGDIGLCNGSLSGNFGTLVLARSDPSHELVKNIILGAEPDLTVNASSAIPCPVAQSETTPTSPTDCISTKPGFPGNELTQGLIQGVDGLNGRLDVNTTPGCDRNGGSSRTPGTYALNDDNLKCFLVNGATIANVRLGGPDQVGLSGEIISSPRFFRIPILPEDPNHGTSTNYPIIDYFYVFITTEGVSPVNGYNGITMRTNGTKIETLSLAALNANSLPDTVPHPGKVTAYTGSGPKVVVLVD